MYQLPFPHKSWVSHEVIIFKNDFLDALEVFFVLYIKKTMSELNIPSDLYFVIVDGINADYGHRTEIRLFQKPFEVYT